MTTSYVHHFHELCEKIRYNTVVFCKETQEVLAFHSQKTILAQKPLLCNLSIDYSTIVRDNSRVFYGFTLELDLQKFLCSGSVNILSLGEQTIVICFFDTRIATFRDNQLPRIMWKNTESRYLGHSEYVPFENNLRESLTGKTDQELYSNDFYQEYQETDHQALQHQVCFFGMVGKIKVDQFTKLVTFHKFPFYAIDGQVAGLIIVYYPLIEPISSGLVATESDRDEMSRLFTKTLNDANVMLVVQNYATDYAIESISDVSPRLGYEIGDFITGNRKLTDIMHPDDLERYNSEMHATLIVRKETYNVTLRLLNADKKTVWAKITHTPLLDETGRIKKVAVMIVFLDVNEMAEFNYERLVKIVDKIHVVFGTRKNGNPNHWDVLTDNINQFGYQATDFLSGKLHYVDIIHPDDVNRYMDTIAKVAQHEYGNVKVDYRIISPRQQINWVREDLYAITIGDVEYLESAIWNISGSKIASEALKRLAESQEVPFNYINNLGEISLTAVLNVLDLPAMLNEFAETIHADLAFFRTVSGNGLMGNPTGDLASYHAFVASYTDFPALLNGEGVSLEPGLFELALPVTIKNNRIGTLLFYGRTDIDASGPVWKRGLKRITEAQAREIRDYAPILTSNLASVLFFASLTLSQMQSTSTFQGDLTQQRKSHAILLELLNIANAATEIDACFKKMMPKIAQVIPLSRASIFTYDKESNVYNCIVEWYEPYESSRIALYQNIHGDNSFYRGWDIKKQNVFIVNSKDEIKEVNNYRQYARAVVGVRLSNKEEIFGVANFVDNHSDRVWSADEATLLEDIGYLITFVIEKIQKQTTIRQNKQQFVRTLESLPNMAIVVQDETAKPLFINRTLRKGFAVKTENDVLRIVEMIRPVELTSNVIHERHFPTIDKWFLINKSSIEFDGSKASLLILTDITENKRSQETMQSLAYTDVLTSLPNRGKFELDLKRMFEQRPSSFTNTFIGIVNIDNFRMINNTYGYQYGDHLIKTIADKMMQISEFSRQVYRFGGDEFAFIVSNLYGEQVYEVAQKIMHIFENPFYMDGYETECTASLGVAYIDESDENVYALIRRANLSVIDAKMQGKNRFVLFDVSLKKYEEDSLTMEKALKKAVDADCADFQIFYQPIVEATSDRIIGAEALVRWFSQEYGLVSPVKFIPIAESTGLIIPLGKYILREACKMAKRWIEQGHDFTISVNFSVIQMLQSDLIQNVMSVLKEFKIPAKHLVIEITESLAINDINKVIEILSALRGIGIKIAIDDFGTGYSSLNHLRQLPLDYVKIDRSFIFNIDFDPYTVAFVETITRFCHLKGAKICSEGVESETQKSLLKTVGVDMLQGYLFAKPTKASEFEKLLDRQQALKH